MENMKDWIKAGKIAAQALDYGCSLVKENASLLEVTEKVEEKIEKFGGKCAFPAQFSINDIAAHYTAFVEDKIIFKKGDLVKVDIGVHVNGAIGDNARTVDLGDNIKMIDASLEALNEAIKLVKEGTKLRDIGKVIEKTIISKKLKPVKNLSGHLIERYTEHAGFNVPNFDNIDETELEEGMVIAIEPFATNGIGMIFDGKKSSIYAVVSENSVRDQITRDVLKFIKEEYQTLPFCKRQLIRHFPEFKINFALRNLVRYDVIKEYTHLPEKEKGLVSQAEHTVLVEKKGCKILTNAE
ncbi:type II methionyl aminopeptidase [Candidatus Woesearchaeota archaeon]|nr:type II methionyl aminopeptidase [Candidatus Woesearchaeota archaeon]